MELDRLQHDRPAACVIAQQYSSATFVTFIPARKNPGRFSEVLLFHYFLFFYFMSEIFEVFTSESRSEVSGKF
jgi:hypothetical protein